MAIALFHLFPVKVSHVEGIISEGTTIVLTVNVLNYQGLTITNADILCFLKLEMARSIGIDGFLGIIIFVIINQF